VYTNNNPVLSYLFHTYRTVFVFFFVIFLVISKKLLIFATSLS